MKRTILSSVLVGLVAAAGGAVADDWSGAYGGVQFGVLDGEVSGPADGDGSGAIAGLHAGYDVDFGTFVLGAEIDLDFGSIDLGDAAEVDGIARLKLRAGADLGRTIVYGTAGVARAETSLGSGEGGFAGVGAGRRVGERAVVGGELLYQEFDDLDGSGETVGATTATARVTFSF